MRSVTVFGEPAVPEGDQFLAYLVNQVDGFSSGKQADYTSLQPRSSPSTSVSVKTTRSADEVEATLDLAKVDGVALKQVPTRMYRTCPEDLHLPQGCADEAVWRGRPVCQVSIAPGRRLSFGTQKETTLTAPEVVAFYKQFRPEATQADSRAKCSPSPRSRASN